MREKRYENIVLSKELEPFLKYQLKETDRRQKKKNGRQWSLHASIWCTVVVVVVVSLRYTFPLKRIFVDSGGRKKTGKVHVVFSRIFLLTLKWSIMCQKRMARFFLRLSFQVACYNPCVNTLSRSVTDKLYDNDEISRVLHLSTYLLHQKIKVPSFFIIGLFME